jgi:hypothetical protein
MDLKNGNHHSLYFQRYFNKNLDAYFICNIIFSSEDDNLISRMEEFLISDLSNLFNLSKRSSGGDLTSYHPNNLDIRNKIKKSMNERYTKKENRDKCSKPLSLNPNWKGGVTKRTICPKCGCNKHYKSLLCKTCNEKNRHGESNSFFGKKHNPETLAKIAETKKIKSENGILQKKPSNTIPVIYKNVEYSSASVLACELGCTTATVLNRCRSKKFLDYVAIC